MTCEDCSREEHCPPCPHDYDEAAQKHYKRTDFTSYPYGKLLCACGLYWPCPYAPRCDCSAEVVAGVGFWHQPDCALRR